MTRSFRRIAQRLSASGRTQRCLAAILLLALVIRLAASLVIGDAATELPGTQDEISYDALAQRVLQGHGLSFDRPWYPWVPANAQTSYYSGAMVLYLAAIYGVAGYHPLVARIVTSVIGVFACYMLYRLGRRLVRSCGGPRCRPIREWLRLHDPVERHADDRDAVHCRSVGGVGRGFRACRGINGQPVGSFGHGLCNHRAVAVVHLWERLAARRRSGGAAEQGS